MSVATGSSEAAGGAGGGGARVFFQSPRGGAGGSPGSSSGSGSSREDSAPVAAAGQVQQQQQQRRHQQGKVTVKYDRKELRKRLVLEEWIVEQLGQLYGCEVPERGAGRVGGLPRPTVPTPEFSRAPALGCAPPCLLGTQRWERGAGRSLSGVPSGAGAPQLGRPCLGPDAGCPQWGALGFAKHLAFLGARGASSLQLQLPSEGLTPAAPNPTRTVLTAEILAIPISVEGEQGRYLKAA